MASVLPPFYSLQTGRYVGEPKFLFAVTLHAIERAIGCPQKLFDGCSILRIYGKPHADGDTRPLCVARQMIADAPGHLCRFLLARFREDENKFIAAVSRRRIDRAAILPQHEAQALDRVASGQMAILIVDPLQAIEVEEQKCKAAAGAARALNFAFQDFGHAEVIRESGA